MNGVVEERCRVVMIKCGPCAVRTKCPLLGLSRAKVPAHIPGTVELAVLLWRVCGRGFTQVSQLVPLNCDPPIN